MAVLCTWQNTSGEASLAAVTCFGVPGEALGVAFFRVAWLFAALTSKEEKRVCHGEKGAPHGKRQQALAERAPRGKAKPG